MIEALQQAIEALAQGAYGEAIVRTRELRGTGSEQALLDERHGATSRSAIVTAQVRARFAALARASRASGDLVAQVAFKYV